MQELAVAGTEKVPSETPSHKEDAVGLDVENDSGTDLEDAAGHMTAQSYIGIGVSPLSMMSSNFQVLGDTDVYPRVVPTLHVQCLPLYATHAAGRPGLHRRGSGT